MISGIGFAHRFQHAQGFFEGVFRCRVEPDQVRIIFLDQLDDLWNRLVIDVGPIFFHQFGVFVEPAKPAEESEIAAGVTKLPIVADADLFAPVEGVRVVDAKL